MFNVLWAKFWPYIAAIGAAFAVFVGIRQSGKAAGKQEIRNEINEAESAARKEARNVELETDAMANSDIDDDLSRWVRDNKR